MSRTNGTKTLPVSTELQQRLVAGEVIYRDEVDAKALANAKFRLRGRGLDVRTREDGDGVCTFIPGAPSERITELADVGARAVSHMPAEPGTALEVANAEVAQVGGPRGVVLDPAQLRLGDVMVVTRLELIGGAKRITLAGDAGVIEVDATE